MQICACPYNILPIVFRRCDLAVRGHCSWSCVGRRRKIGSGSWMYWESEAIWCSSGYIVFSKMARGSERPHFRHSRVWKLLARWEMPVLPEDENQSWIPFGNLHLSLRPNYLKPDGCLSWLVKNYPVFNYPFTFIDEQWNRSLTKIKLLFKETMV